MRRNMDVLISLKAEIQAQKEGQEKIQKLCFENIDIGTFTTDIIKLLQKYPDVVSLEFNDCNLSDIENLNCFQNLTKLRLCNNGLDKNCLSLIVKHFPKVTYLDLSGNKKITQDDLKVLVELKDLQHLILGDVNREQLYETIPQLNYIDHKDKQGNDVVDDDDDDIDEDDDDEEDDDLDNGDSEDGEGDEDEEVEEAEEVSEEEEESQTRKKKKQQ